jgi:hypothetical protein
MSVGRASIGYLYMLELIPTENQALAGTILHFVNSSVTILSCIYFYFISKYWLWFQVFGWSLNLLTVVCVIFMPESPKFLLTKKKYDECREVLTKMAVTNNRESPFDGKFDREIQDSIGSYRTPNRVIDKDPLKTPKLIINEEQQMTGGFKDLVRVRRHFINLIIMVSVWIASSFDFYLLNF